MDEQELFHRAELWARMDPDPDTRTEIRDHLNWNDVTWLESHFGSPLTFGTAGIRGPVGPGSARMNRAAVCLMAKALADTLDIGRVEGPVVVAHDARRESRGFARDIVTVLRQAGRQVIACRGPVATPVASWVARNHQAPAAVVVTASHNPIGDAGVKIYGPMGAQIVPPRDALITAGMDASAGLASLAATVPADLVDEPTTERLGGLTIIEEAHRDYEELMLLRLPRVDGEGLRIATSALHGVAGDSVVRLLEAAGHRVHPVAAQQEPDGTFPTLTSPNPEDPVALELLLAEAADGDADLAMANDPDGDRLAVAVPTDHGWRVLTGNEVGILLADHLLTEPGRLLLVSTVVSTPLVEALARERGVMHLRTWTGFKWIVAAMDWAERTEGAVLTLGFEEAMGYCIGDVVRDKDGISAAVSVAAMAAHLRDQGSSLLDRLSRLQEQYGVWVSASVSLAAESVDADALVDRVVASPPSELDGREVVEVIDHRQPISDQLLWQGLPPAPIAELRSDGARVLVRPSGTEPKVKLYVHLHEPPNGNVGGVEADLAQRAGNVLEAVAERLGLA